MRKNKKDSPTSVRTGEVDPRVADTHAGGLHASTADGHAGGKDPKSRRRAIMDHVVQAGATHVDQLARLLGVSTMTVYRDVAQLERSQLVSLNRGEVVPAETSLTEAAAHVRVAINPRVKGALAAQARQFLSPGCSVVMDDSSSNIPLLKYLPDYAPITVVTNAEFVASKVRAMQGVRLILTGGEYEAWAESYFGDLAEAAVNQLRIDVCIMSATALSAQWVYHPNQNVARVKRAMIAAARKKVLVVDSSKFAKSALYKVGPTTDFDTIITDQHTPSTVVEQLREAGVEVSVVQV